MARSRRPVNPQAENALDRMKFEVASELGIAERVRQQGWNTMTSADCGRVGGHMVRRMIEQYEAGISSSGTTSTFTNTTTGTTATTGTTGTTATTGSTMTSEYNINR